MLHKTSNFRSGSSKNSAKWALSGLLLATFTGFLLNAGCAAELANPEQYAQGGSTGLGGITGTSGGTQPTNGGGPTGSGGTTSSVPPDPPCVTALMRSRCTLCHNQSTASMPESGGIDLSGSGLGAMLTAKTSANCGGLVIDPANPETSLMMKKVDRTTTCGSPMPVGGTLTEEELTCMQNWMKAL